MGDFGDGFEVFIWKTALLIAMDIPFLVSSVDC
jgi:hypothetical protein